MTVRTLFLGIGLGLGFGLVPAAAPALAAPAGQPMTALQAAGAHAPDPHTAGPHIVHVSAAAGPVHRHMTLGLDKSAVIDLDVPAHDVLVANPDIVNAVVRSPRRVFLLATKTGQTNAFFFDEAGRQILSIDIRVERDVTDLSAMMKADLPDSDIKVSSMNDTVVLSGTVANATESSHAAALAASFTGDPKKVVNMLGIAGGEQVMLKVRIAEMDRNVAKQFGINAAGAANVDGVPIIASTSNPFGLLGHALSDASGAQLGATCAIQSTGACTGGPNNAQGILQALEQVGLVHILAEPNLTAVSGETAKFLAGGEFPVPVAKDNQGNVTVDFKTFGVGLSFTPVVLSPGRISLQISTEDSELTNTGAYTLQGGTSVVNGVTTTTPALTIPALSVRRAETTVELPSGGSFAIAGLMSHETKQVINGFPGLKDLPILGALFRSRDFENDETELVVLATVYLVKPNTEKAFAAPTDGFAIPTDPETLLLGRLNAVYRKDKPPLKAQAKAPVGFVVR